MAYSKEMIEWLHDSGKMPDWIYYQQNGKSLQENYTAQKLKQQKQIEELLNDRQEARAEKELEAEIEKKVSETVENALEELLKDFH